MTNNIIVLLFLTAQITEVVVLLERGFGTIGFDRTMDSTIFGVFQMSLSSTPGTPQ